MLKDPNKPSPFYFFEIFRDETAYQAHRETENFKTWRHIVNHMMEGSPGRMEMESVFPSDDGLHRQKPSVLNGNRVGVLDQPGPAPAISRRLLDSPQPPPSTEVLMLLIGLAVVFALSLTLVPVAAEGQQTGKVAHIGYLSPLSAARDSPNSEAFRQGLRDLGYVEGQNALIDARYADGKFEMLPDLAAEIVRLNVHVIVAAPTPAVRAVQQATRTIPIVMAFSGDPVGEGFAVGLARPGGNITGHSAAVAEMSAKRVEFPFSALPPSPTVGTRERPVFALPPGSAGGDSEPLWRADNTWGGAGTSEKGVCSVKRAFVPSMLCPECLQARTVVCALST